MNRYSEILKSWKAPEGLSEEQALAEIQGRLSNESNKGNNHVRTMLWSAASVAAAVLVAWVFLMPNNRVIREATEVAASKTIVLPDGSKATLNADSRISYAEDWSDVRTLELHGEAFFEVEKGSAFTVNTPTGAVIVLGTSFNVYSRGQELKVACNTGKVRVLAGQEQVELTPGQCANRQGEELMVANFDTDQKTWRQGVFYYENARLGDILEEMERQFSIRIECTDDVRNVQGITTNFSKDDREAAFQTVSAPVGMEFIALNNTTFKLQKRP
jgi:ferric-dicitrate binding protein FerR (iron transport regulator)